MSNESSQELFCRSCGWSAVSLPGFIVRLQAAGLLKRNAEPAAAEVHELAAQVIERLSCPDCEGRLVLEATEDWPTARTCEACKKPIPPERLEVFPNATVCVGCQRLEESGETPPDAIDFCPRCGSAMTMRSVRSGVTRYVMQCTSPGCRTRG